MPTRAPTYSIILAAGKGTRMRSPSMHKVCFPIDGVPAVNRAIATYDACGIRHHVVVVGAMAGQVVETVGNAVDNASFVYQGDQLGTAHATRVALRSIDVVEGDLEMLVVAGDRLIEASVLEQFFDTFYSGNYDLALLATPRREGSTQGRVVLGPDDELLGIVEDADVRQRRTYAELRRRLAEGPAPTRQELQELVRDVFSRNRANVTEAKLQKAFGNLWTLLGELEAEVSVDGVLAMAPVEKTCFEFVTQAGKVLQLSPDEVDAGPLMNNSVYLVRRNALRDALARLGRDNAQQEEYLSDIVGLLSQGRDREGKPYRCRALPVNNPNYLLGFNDPAELLEVESYVRSQRNDHVYPELAAAPWYRPVGEWQTSFGALAAGETGADAPLWKELNDNYGSEDGVVQERVATYRQLLDEAAEVLGPSTPALIVRSPGRINVLSRHIDHQGGNCNLMTIGYETLMVVHARNDDTIRLFHLDKERFGTREFTISKLVMELPWEDWLSLVNSDKLQNMLHTYGGDWSQYVTAAVLRLQMKFKHRKLRGMDMVVTGNVPMAAGLSSSSSLVVGAADATIAVNQLLTFPSQVVDLCGEGEWFVGTRGGAADHAAVKLGQKSMVIKVRFFDFAVEGAVPFPDDYCMAVCDSGIRARKSANAKDQFNHRIACYRIGFLLIKKYFPQFAPLLHHLRDVNVRTLGVPLSWIYRILLHLPEQATRDELRELLPGHDLSGFFATHKEPDDGLYPIRGVVLFGLAECERAQLYADYLRDGKMDEIGRLMNVSHDGDRVASCDADLREQPYLAPTGNGYLLKLMDDLESGSPERVIAAQLQWQPGSYHCSLPPIDRMVDISLRTPGVVGAQLAGAGLGGCMMVLARRDAVDGLIANLDRDYYGPQGKPSGVLVCKPIAGAGIVLWQ